MMSILDVNMCSWIQQDEFCFHTYSLSLCIFIEGLRPLMLRIFSKQCVVDSCYFVVVVVVVVVSICKCECVGVCLYVCPLQNCWSGIIYSLKFTGCC